MISHFEKYSDVIRWVVAIGLLSTSLSRPAVAAETLWKGKLSLKEDKFVFQPCYEELIYTLSGPVEVMDQLRERYKNVKAKKKPETFLTATGTLSASGTLTISKFHRLNRQKTSDCGDYFKADSLNIHPSWLEAPPGTPFSVQCDQKGRCECGKNNKLNIHSENSDESTEHRLQYYFGVLRTQWKAYLESQSPTMYSCPLLFAQVYIQTHYPRISKKLGGDYEKYMDQVRKLNDKCPHPEEMGWTQSEKAKDWVRCTREIRPELHNIHEGKRGLRIRYEKMKDALGALHEPKPERF